MAEIDMANLLIANILSFISACFTIASSWTKDPVRTYLYQVFQCLVYGAASYFFGVPAAIAVMLVNAFRNYLIAVRKYSVRWMVICSAAALIVGLAVNGVSIPGYISIFMTVYYTISSFFMTGAAAVKINVAVDLTMWFIYDLMVKDVSNGIVDFVSVVLALITLRRILGDRKKQKGV